MQREGSLRSGQCSSAGGWADVVQGAEAACVPVQSHLGMRMGALHTGAPRLLAYQHSRSRCVGVHCAW